MNKSLSLLFACQMALLTSMTAASAENANNGKALPGHVEKRSGTRITRPVLPGGIQQLRSGLGANAATPQGVSLDASQFNVNAKDLNSGASQMGTPIAPLQITLPAHSARPSTHLIDPAAEKKLREKTDVKNPPPVADNSDAQEEEMPVDDENDKARFKGRRVMVRFTGFNEDPDLTPQVNRDGFEMANSLQQLGAKVTIFLDENSVKLAGTGYPDFAVEHVPVNFHKLIQHFVDNGGKIVLNKWYAERLGMNGNSLHAGATVMPSKDVARRILNQVAVLQYCGPLFPYMYTKAVSKDAIQPPIKSCKCDSTASSGTASASGSSSSGTTSGAASSVAGAKN